MIIKHEIKLPCGISYQHIIMSSIDIYSIRILSQTNKTNTMKQTTVKHIPQSIQISTEYRPVAPYLVQD